MAVEGLEKFEDMVVRAAETTAAHARAAKAAIGAVIFGQERVVERALITILSGGHGLLIGVPGLAKTKLVETMGIALGLNARRIQFTPDLMPSDILGSEVLEETPSGRRDFRFLPGPIFAQLLMADEINRASPRTQSALLQAMQEHHVTVAGARHDLPAPFHVLATQNPLEQEGTYPLPEAQLDRFLMEIDVDYPDREAERKILFDTTGVEETKVKAAMTAEDLQAAQRLVRRLPVGESVVEAILALVPDATRRATVAGRQLSATMPRLILEARRVAATIIHGLHGRRRAGSGENFWQFRRFMSGEPAARVDWRRSARDDNLYVREREWEAAHTVWIWPDRSPSMVFASALVWETKLDRALIVAFALAEVLVEGGERVGIPGLMRPTASRNIIERMAETIVHDPTARASLPPSFAPSPQSEVVVLSDLWSPIADVHRTIAQLSANGAHGHVVQIVDPAEETFPFSGRVEFFEPEGAGAVTAGRAETWRAEYEVRVERHRAEIRAETDRLAWSFTVHRTDRPATDLLLRLHTRMGAGIQGTGINRWRAAAAHPGRAS